MEVSSTQVLYGVVSYILNDCADNWPSVFARVSAYKDWVESTVGSTYLEFTDGLEYFLVQGALLPECTDETDPTCTTRSVNQNELWNVRCCADTDPNGWLQNSHIG